MSFFSAVKTISNFPHALQDPILIKFWFGNGANVFNLQLNKERCAGITHLRLNLVVICFFVLFFSFVNGLGSRSYQADVGLKRKVCALKISTEYPLTDIKGIESWVC